MSLRVFIIGQSFLNQSKLCREFGLLDSNLTKHLRNIEGFSNLLFENIFTILVEDNAYMIVYIHTKRLSVTFNQISMNFEAAKCLLHTMKLFWFKFDDLPLTER